MSMLPGPAASGPVASPDCGPGDGGGDSGHPVEHARGPGPVENRKGQLQLQPGLGVIRGHPGVVAPAPGVGQWSGE